MTLNSQVILGRDNVIWDRLVSFELPLERLRRPLDRGFHGTPILFLDIEEVYNTERHLLYVACTRARKHLLVSGAGPASFGTEPFTFDERLLRR